MDVDFICPIVHIGSKSWYFNNSKGRRNCLAKMKPIGWFEELLKVTESNNFIDIQRFGNRDQNGKEKH